MEKELKRLIKDIQTDEALDRDFVEAKLSKDDIDGIAAFAVKHGYDITADELKTLAGKEIPDEELSGVAGGTYFEGIYVDDENTSEKAFGFINVKSAACTAFFGMAKYV